MAVFLTGEFLDEAGRLAPWHNLPLLLDDTSEALKIPVLLGHGCYRCVPKKVAIAFVGCEWRKHFGDLPILAMHERLEVALTSTQSCRYHVFDSF